MVQKLRTVILKKSFQYIIFLALSSVILILTELTSSANSEIFHPFFGKIHPFIAVLIVFTLGLISVTFLLVDGRFVIYKTGNLRGILTAAGLAIPFAIIMIFIDYMAPYPADINVAFPLSLTFYPEMGYVVEVLFHLLPFSIIYLSLKRLFPGISTDKTIWTAILVTALIEPVFQIFFTSGSISILVTSYLAVHLLLFSLVQLVLFKRYDFITMFSFRLSYYVLWHMVWGYFRLELLF